MYALLVVWKEPREPSGLRARGQLANRRSVRDANNLGLVGSQSHEQVCVRLFFLSSLTWVVPDTLPSSPNRCLFCSRQAALCHTMGPVLDGGERVGLQAQPLRYGTAARQRLRGVARGSQGAGASAARVSGAVGSGHGDCKCAALCKGPCWSTRWCSGPQYKPSCPVRGMPRCTCVEWVHGAECKCYHLP